MDQQITHLKNALVFMSRASLTGKEVQAYQDSVHVIKDIIVNMESSPCEPVDGIFNTQL